jgi:hypothetical protein
LGFAGGVMVAAEKMDEREYQAALPTEIPLLFYAA